MSFNLEKYNTFGLEVKAAFGFVLNDMAMLPLILKKNLGISAWLYRAWWGF